MKIPPSTDADGRRTMVTAEIANLFPPPAAAAAPPVRRRRLTFQSRLSSMPPQHSSQPVSVKRNNTSPPEEDVRSIVHNVIFFVLVDIHKGTLPDPSSERAGFLGDAEMKPRFS